MVESPFVVLVLGEPNPTYRGFHLAAWPLNHSLAVDQT
jgi:hypothetical protein